MTIKVFLADDHVVMVDGLRSLLETQPDMKVVGAASNGRDVVRQAVALRPDVIVMDIAMPELNGVDATRQVHQECPATRVVILSMHSTAEHIFQALRAGALGYVLKESAGAELVLAIRTVYAGRPYLSHKLTDTIKLDTGSNGKSPLERLTRREVQVLQLTVEGKSAAEIGSSLLLSPKTIETYRSRLMHKLGLNDLPSLVKFAIQHGLTPPN
ncbi:MAG TPA: response regulator transcription factor [Aggregatilineales bacterium]|nr:response regulator transcription factor [Aggregatilineales bacterium]